MATLFEAQSTLLSIRSRSGNLAAGLLWFVVLTSCAIDSDDSSGTNLAPAGSTAQWQKIPANFTEKIQLKYFGFIDVTQDEEGESQYFEAGFAQFQKTAPISILLESFTQPKIDSCDYRQRERGDSRPLKFKDELELKGHPYDWVSAGSKIEILRGNRRYAKLTRTSSNPEDAVQYETDVGSLPISFGGFKLGDALLKTRGLFSRSAGDVFPGFSGIAVPAIDVVEGFKPRINEEIKADTVMRWRQGKYNSDPNVRVQIEAGGGGRAIFCAVADDGKFELPEDVKTKLGDAGLWSPIAYRDSIAFYMNNEALLIVSQSSYY